MWIVLQEENKKGKDGANIRFCIQLGPCSKTAKSLMHMLRLASSIKRKVLHCAASKTTLLHDIIVTIQLIWLSSRREIQNQPCRNLSFPVSSSPMQVQILNAFLHSNAGKPLSCQRTDNTECHNILLTLEAAHHGHRWHFHHPSWLMHLPSLLPLLLLVSIQR